MSTGLNNYSENALLLLLFNNTAWANIGNAAGLQPSGVAGTFSIALHTGTGPGQAGTNQQANEAAYTNYGRQTLARAAANWVVSGSSPTYCNNNTAITFNAATGGSETETYVSIGLTSTGANEYLFFGALTANLAVSSPIQPIFAANALSVTLQ
jgi:hypothetical protein